MDFKQQTFALRSVCHFLLAQKVTKKGTLPNAASRKTNAPLAGQRGQPAFFPLCNLCLTLTHL